MAQTINWVQPNNSLVGSVLIYRANDNFADSLGSRTVQDTISAKNPDDTWVTQYTDVSGTVNNVYRIQFWDGVGSSPLSDPVSQDVSELLATYDDVVREARVRNSDIGSDEIYFAIKDATLQTFDWAGDPIKKSVFYIDNETGLKGVTYNVNGDYGPIYMVREVLVDSEDTVLVPSTSYTVDYTNGNIKFTDAFLGSYVGKNVLVQWVPVSYHLLVKSLAALYIVEGELTFSGVDVESPNVGRLNRKVNQSLEALRPKGVFSPKTPNILTPYDVVAQKLDRSSLYFNY